jgi:hypothetical protein
VPPVPIQTTAPPAFQDIIFLTIYAIICALRFQSNISSIGEHVRFVNRNVRAVWTRQFRVFLVQRLTDIFSTRLLDNAL